MSLISTVMGSSPRWLAIAAAVVAGVSVAGCSGANHDSVDGHLNPETVVVANGVESLMIEGGAPATSNLGIEVTPGSGFAVTGSRPGVATISRRSGGAGARHLTVRLSRTQVWQVIVRGGTTSTALDLSGLMLSQVHVTGGAERLTISLPAPRGRASLVAVSGGATTVAVDAPQGTAIQVAVGPGIARGVVVGADFVSNGAPRVFLVGSYAGAPDSYSVQLTAGASRLVVSEP